MLSILFIVLMVMVFGKLIGLAFRATWGITKIVFSFVLFPVVLIALFIGGLVYIAIPILLLAGIIALIKSAA